MGIVRQTEKALIGAILLRPDKIADLVGQVSPEDFLDPVARKAYLLVVNLWRQKKTVDLVSVAAEDMSIATYLAEATSTGTPIGASDYARQVAMAAKTRRVNGELVEIAKDGLPVSMKLDSLLSLYQREMQSSGKNANIDAVLKRFIEHQENNMQAGRLGFCTGFDFLEKKFIRYVPGHLWMMGAFTSVGKTAMMVQKICNLLLMEKTPSMVIISSEMTEEQVVARIIGNLTGIHPFRILSGSYRHGEKAQVEKCWRMIAAKPLKIHDDIYTLGGIETAFRMVDLQGGVDIGFIDYVQNCRVPEARSSYQEGAIMAKRLQQMAKDMRCALICLSQVSNDVGRGGTDQLEYKGAGEWSAVADVGIFLERNSKEKYRLRYHVKKNRHGMLTGYEFEYKADYTRLEAVNEIN